MAARNVFLFAYFLSGFAALVYEIVWVREATHVLGASLYGVSAVSGLFLAGLALGAAAGARLFRRTTTGDADDAQQLLTRRLYLFLAIEVLVAAVGMLLPVAFSSSVQQIVWSCLGGGVAPSMSYVLRLIFVGLLVVPAATGIGMTFPLTVSIAGSRLKHAGQWLYAVNTAGAAVGAVVAAFFLLPAVGLQASSFVAAAADVMAGALAVALCSKCFLPLPPEPSAQVRPKQPWGNESSFTLSLSVVLGVALAGGALSLCFEIVATRLMMLVLGSSTYSVSCVLAWFLTGTAIGTLVVCRFLLRYRQPALICAASLGLAAAYMCTILYVSDELPWGFIACFKAMDDLFQGNAFSAALASRFIVSGAMVLIPAILNGAVLPLLFDATAPVKADVSGAHDQMAPRLYAANSLGCVMGALSTGFLFIPLFSALAVSGIQITFLSCAGLEAGLAALLFFAWSKMFISDRETRLFTDGIVLVVIVAVALDVAFFKPTWNPIIMSSGPSFYSPQELLRVSRPAFLHAIGAQAYGTAGSALLFYREGLNSTVTVEKNARLNALFLKNDGKVEASLPLDAAEPAPTTDVSTHRALGELPLQLQETGQAKVLLIGYGTGTTAGAVRSMKNVSDLTIAELEPAVLQADRCFASATGDPLGTMTKPAVQVLINDGRYVLSSSRSKFDAVICQPSDPWVNGACELYSLEFFRLAKSRLAAQGIFCQWLPLYSISPQSLGVMARTFTEAFPEAVLYHQKDAGECILLGFNAAAPDKLLDRLNRQEGASFIGAAGIRQMVKRLGDDTHDQRVNTDDNLATEFAAAANALTQEQRIEQNIELIEASRR